MTGAFTRVLIPAAFVALAGLGAGCGGELSEDVLQVVGDHAAAGERTEAQTAAPASADAPSAADLFRILFAAGRDPHVVASAAPISDDNDDESDLDRVPAGGKVSATSPDPAPERGTSREEGSDECEDGYEAYGDKCLPEDLVDFLEQLASSPDPAPEDNG